tara:strand:+ start:844 stop:1041 length:198 start_codon:yes stop_codon:yes gene_type:complete
MDSNQEGFIENRGEIRMFKMVIKQMAKRFKLKDILIKVGDLYVQSTRSETDDKVWNKAKEFIKKL